MERSRSQHVKLAVRISKSVRTLRDPAVLEAPDILKWEDPIEQAQKRAH
jgi:hypothetical protein